MAETKSINRGDAIGMDMCAPFGVYVNGEQVAVYQTEAQAQAEYLTLCARTNEQPAMSCTPTNHQ